MANVTTNNSLSLEQMQRPFKLGLTVDGLMKELEITFPELSPQRNESHEALMWRGGERSVVNWIRSRIQEESNSG